MLQRTVHRPSACSHRASLRLSLQSNNRYLLRNERTSIACGQKPFSGSGKQHNFGSSSFLPGTSLRGFSLTHVKNISLKNKSIFGFGALLAILAIQSMSTDDKDDDEEKSEQEKATTEQSDKQPEVRHFKYVIVGAGTAGYYALKEIQKRDKDAKILVISEESCLPYQRPPLSKNLWKTDDPNVTENLAFKQWDGTEGKVWFEEEINDPNVTFLFGTTATDVIVQQKKVVLADETEISYDKCLIATGGDPRTIPGVDTSVQDKVTTFRTVEDFKKLAKVADDSKHIIVIGGGFLGSELACGLAHKGKSSGLKVSQVFPESGVMALAFPEYLSNYATEQIRSELGVDIRPHQLVSSIKPTETGQVEVELKSGDKLQGDHVVVAAGIKPALGLAKNDFEIDDKNGGLVVNVELLARSDVYAAGDIISYYDAGLGRRRVEHYDHAVASGQLAGKNMTGQRSAYSYTPMFWGDLGSMGYEAVGTVDSSLQTVSIWEKPATATSDSLDSPQTHSPDFKRGLVYYLNKENVVVGVVLWNVWNQVNDARHIVRSGLVVKNPEDLKHFISLEDDQH